MNEYEAIKSAREDVRQDGRKISRKTIADDKLIGVQSIANNTITQAMMSNNSIGQGQLKTETASVTVNAGATSGTASVTSGNIVLGYYPTTNQDQFVKSISISGTTLTVTLLAAATANNVFNIVMLKI